MTATDNAYLCHLDDITEGSARGFDYQGHALFGIKKDQQLYLYRNSCPHLGIELNWLPDQFLDMDGMLIQCSTHGALFLIDSGKCVAGPCQGELLQAIPFELCDGRVIPQLALASCDNGNPD